MDPSSTRKEGKDRWSGCVVTENPREIAGQVERASPSAAGHFSLLCVPSVRVTWRHVCARTGRNNREKREKGQASALPFEYLEGRGHILFRTFRFRTATFLLLRLRLASPWCVWIIFIVSPRPRLDPLPNLSRPSGKLDQRGSMSRT